MSGMRTIYVSFYTDFYEAAARDLIASLDRFGLPHRVLHVEDAGSWRENVRRKPGYIWQALSQYTDYDAVVWLDADVEVLAYPHLFEMIGADMAFRFHYWPKIDVDEPIAAAMWFRNRPEVRAFVKDWSAEVMAAGDIRRVEQQVLRSKLEQSTGLTVFRLPEDYGALADFRGTPVIRNRQWTKIAGVIPKSAAQAAKDNEHEAERKQRKAFADEQIRFMRYLKRERKHRLPKLVLPAGRMAAVSVCFDGARLCQLELAEPMLRKRGLRGVFYAVPGAVRDTSRCWHPESGLEIPIAGWDLLCKAAANGHEIGNHSFSHLRFAQIPKEQQSKRLWKRETIRAAKEIARRTGKPHLSWAWPYHEPLECMNRVIEDTHIGVRPLQPRYSLTRATTTDLKPVWKWIEGLLRRNGWGVLVVHDIGEGREGVATDAFAAVLDRLKRMEQKLWIETPSNIWKAAYGVKTLKPPKRNRRRGRGRRRAVRRT